MGTEVITATIFQQIISGKDLLYSVEIFGERTSLNGSLGTTIRWAKQRGATKIVLAWVK